MRYSERMTGIDNRFDAAERSLREIRESIADMDARIKALEQAAGRQTAAGAPAAGTETAPAEKPKTTRSRTKNKV